MKYINYLFVAVMFLILPTACGDLDIGGSDSGDVATDSGNTTLNGSYASILEVGDYVYAVNREQIFTFKSTDTGLDEVDRQDVGFRIENIYHYGGVLFIGSEGSLYIYAIGENGIPAKKSETEYVSFDGADVGPCDPVIARGDVAYVTLSTAATGRCNRVIWVNELRTYDVTDIESPVLLTTTTMVSPKGLGFKDDYLLVCDNEAGVKIFDISDSKGAPELINELRGFTAIDLIVNGDKLLVVGTSEIRQFDISDIYNISEYGAFEI